MVDPELTKYIKSMKDSGFSDEETRKKLLDAGWDAREVNAALGTGPAPAAREAAKPAVPRKTGTELPVFTIIGNAFSFMTGEFGFWKDFFLVLLVLQIGTAIVTGVASFFMLGGVADPSMMGYGNYFSHMASVVPLMLLSLVVGLIVGIISLIVQLGLLKGVDARLDGKAFTLQEGFSFGTSKIVVALIASAVAALLVLLGFLFLIVPGIYLVVPLILILPAIAIGGKDIGSAISECFRLTKGRWWRGLRMGIAVVLVAMAYGFATALILLPVNLILSLLSRGLSYIGPGAVLIPSLLSQILQTAVLAPLSIFVMVALAMYYRNLRECTPR